MTLYLLRHAEAENPTTSDFARALTGKGEAQAQRVGNFCAANALVPEVIFASPLRRTQETAAIVARELKGVEVVTAPWLASGMDPATALAELRALLRFSRVMLVGHEPDLSSLAGALLGIAQGGGLYVRKASLTALELSSARPGAATLDFFLPVKFM